MKHKVFYLLIGIVLLSSLRSLAQSAVNSSAWKTLTIRNEQLVNTSGMESSPAFLNDRIGFVTSPNISDKKDGLNEPFYNLASVKVDLDNSLGTMETIHPRINSDVHEGPMCYDAHSNTLFFTRSHIEKRIKKGKTIDTSYLRIMSANLNLAKPKIVPINLNVANYSVCHPTISKDGKTMIFSSNQPFGNGGMDLYVSSLEGDTWSLPINLGKEVNTPQHELFPYLVNDTLLLFSSNQPNGMGGLDIYVSVKRNYVWQKPEALLSPINSPFDDLGMIMRPNMKSGYFASNRPGGKGKDDIYSFQSLEPLLSPTENKKFISQLDLLDKLTFEPIDNAKVSISPIDIDINEFILSSFNVDVLSGREPGEIYLKIKPESTHQTTLLNTNDKGQIKFEVLKNKKYLISVEANSYKSLNILYDYDIIGQEFNLVMEPIETDTLALITQNIDINKSNEIEIPTKKGSVIIFEKIYYAYNSSKILEEASDELDILAKAMEMNPDMNIRIESHTDSRGTDTYNLQLSIKRAEAVRQYLNNKGILEDRMTIRGWGESKPRNRCKDGIKCTELEHKFNRRTEIIIE